MKQKLAISLVGFILFLFWLESSTQWCFSLAIPLFFLGLISWNSYSYAKVKKICLGRCFFDEKSLLYTLWTRKTVIFLLSVFLGLLLSISLIMASFQFTWIDKTILFFDSFLLVLLHTLLEKNSTFNSNVKRAIIKNITAWLNSLFIIILLFIIGLYQTPPEYLHTDLESTLGEIQKSRYSQCSTIDMMAYVSSIVVATKWWLLSKATFILENDFLKKLLWFFQLLGNYMVFFAYSRFILELVDIFTKQKVGETRER
jgi:magnesium-transporting ATPase (P-type)